MIRVKKKKNRLLFWQVWQVEFWAFLPQINVTKRSSSVIQGRSEKFVFVCSDSETPNTENNDVLEYVVHETVLLIQKKKKLYSIFFAL